MSNKPDVQVNVYLVGHGHQTDVLIDGKEVASECRDFGGTYDIKELRDVVASYFVFKMMEQGQRPKKSGPTCFRDKIETAMKKLKKLQRNSKEKNNG